ncbi:T9SS type A sorting domain-containing protein [Algoriphagus sediminis]|uniref:T9SS type A sorting domain-containing protein n=1 Tax=Algoriphagus sediminis TaxID=3057113 RepID=A0ABT7YGG7_9BACT|nr:T9SS type A sorting domain-containing protein [Algoriphagus sediminis]MDN3205621.1 T9SS type A sorting domain-containing protein [Algoriphagus sediminis]
MKNHLVKPFLFVIKWVIFVCISHSTFAQEVDNKRCPQIYKRNNGNGQRITEFADNISPVSSYFLNALTKNYEGTFTFGWGAPILYPPVVTKSWITDTNGSTRLDWTFGNNNSGSPFNPPGVPNSNQVSYNFHISNLPTAGVITIEFSDPQDDLPICICSYPLTNGTASDVKLIGEENLRVSSGNDGGLESKSLGTAVVEQIFSKYQNGNVALNYQRQPSLKNYQIARTQGFTLDFFIPNEDQLGEEFTGYITSPTELLEITNAEEVVSVDYLKEGNNFATLFATETSGVIYEHSKYVCDRLKGSEVLAIDSVQVGNYKLIRSLLNPPSGLNEYAVSFSVGFNQTSSEFHLQSAWLLEDYQSEEKFFNFQFWSADAKVLQRMIEAVIASFESTGNISQTVAKTQPGIFISKSVRKSSDPSKVELTIWNRTHQSSVQLISTSKRNESSNVMLTETKEVALTPMGIQKIEWDAQDYAETSLELLSSTKQDYIYESDGLWASFVPSGGQVRIFDIQNQNELQAKEGTYPIWRNVQFESSGSDYATVYKTIKGGGVPADLTGFNYLNFEASGTGNLTIRLIKKSVQKFEEHYSYTVALSTNSKIYSLPLSSFQSPKINTPVQLNDLVILSFTVESKDQLQVQLKSINFGREKELVNTNPLKVRAYPNPFSTQTTLVFESATGGPMDLGLLSMDSGKLIQNQIIETKAGSNSTQLILSPNVKKGLYILRISSNKELLTTKLLVR